MAHDGATAAPPFAACIAGWLLMLCWVVVMVRCTRDKWSGKTCENVLCVVIVRTIISSPVLPTLQFPCRVQRSGSQSNRHVDHNNAISLLSYACSTN